MWPAGAPATTRVGARGPQTEDVPSLAEDDDLTSVLTAASGFGVAAFVGRKYKYDNIIN
jgi:hypothetical protein